jgi:hypothetical protein
LWGGDSEQGKKSGEANNTDPSGEEKEKQEPEESDPPSVVKRRYSVRLLWCAVLHGSPIVSGENYVSCYSIGVANK